MISTRTAIAAAASVISSCAIGLVALNSGPGGGQQTTAQPTPIIQTEVQTTKRTVHVPGSGSPAAASAVSASGVQSSGSASGYSGPQADRVSIERETQDPPDGSDAAQRERVDSPGQADDGSEHGDEHAEEAEGDD